MALFGGDTKVSNQYEIDSSTKGADNGSIVTDGDVTIVNPDSTAALSRTVSDVLGFANSTLDKTSGVLMEQSAANRQTLSAIKPTFDPNTLVIVAGLAVGAFVLSKAL